VGLVTRAGYRAAGGLLLLGLSQCHHLSRRATLAYMAVAAELAPDRVSIEVNRSFLERYMNRVTISAMFTVDAVAGSPNPASFDGDLHFAGRAPEVGLRLVGEIKNAADADSGVALLRRAAVSRAPLPISGAWRLWPEHSLGWNEQQGRPIQRLDSPYPDHVFEIHPVTRVGNLDLLRTIYLTEGYRPGSGKRTLDTYQDAKCTLTVTPTTITLETPTWLYNDVHFVMELTETRQQVVGDGRFVTARALDQDGEVLVERLRMVFIAGTAPERAVRSLERGARLHIWGLPRLNFAEMWRRAEGSRSDPSLLEGPLPYEIMVVGVYP
jgi:hypothetical protein